MYILEEKSPCVCKDAEHPKKKSKSSDKFVIQLSEGKDCIAFAPVRIISKFSEKAKAASRYAQTMTMLLFQFT